MEVYDPEAKQLLDDYQDALTNCFVVPGLLTLWLHIHNGYEYLHLKQPDTNEEKIEEFDWICQNYHKYVFSKQAEIMKLKEEPNKLLHKLDDLIGSAPDKVTYLDAAGNKSTKDKGKPSTKHLVYQLLRDQWLMEIHQLVEQADNVLEEVRIDG